MTWYQHIGEMAAKQAYQHQAAYSASAA